MVVSWFVLLRVGYVDLVEFRRQKNGGGERYDEIDEDRGCFTV